MTNLIIPNSPIVNAGVLYANGVGIAKTAAQTLSMALGAARDSTNTNDIILTAPVSINGAYVGANGVDVAVLADSSLYAVYEIGDSTEYQPTAALLSLNATQPNLPGGFPQGGYDMYRRVGWVRTDGSAYILQFWEYGSDETRTYYYDVGISVLSAGAATSFTAVNLSTAVPPVATEVLVNYTFTGTATTDIAEFLPYGSTASSGIVQISGGVTTAQTGMVWIPCQLNSGVPEILYKVTGTATLTLLVVGFKDYIT
ncbi:hypothetical protein UFOVP93_7 [uncultured Caudovirales phage]|uniref:Uncharacterized protein n=1 Tax=uncultured Caudovirales phage TaxID=2100421 RepID=A0A6J5L709_9CAUD|nr:hypothetical protein UFOVP93_7 [uncultured Caudovirales phage]